MARHDFELFDPRDVPLKLEDPADEIVHIDGVLRLKRKDAAGMWSPVGTYSTGELVVHTWRPTKLRELLGFWALTREPAVGDQVRFRLSNDEGTSQLYWDGSTWRTPATNSEWNTELEVDAGIPEFPFQGSLTFSIRLTSGTGASTPELRAFYVFYEIAYDPTEDLLRSLMDKILGEVRIPAEDVYPLPVADDELVIEDQPWDIADQLEVFNLDNDPHLTTNLVVSRAGTTIQLASPQTGTLLVRYLGSLRQDQVHISSDGDFQLQRLPAVVILPTTQAHTPDHLEPEFPEQLRSKGIVRLRTTPPRNNYTFQIQAVSQYSLHDKKLADGLRRAFNAREYVRSLALDEEFSLVGLELVSQTNQTRDQLFTRVVNTSVSVLEWLPGFRDVPMVKTIIQRLGPGPGTDPETINTE